MSVSKEKFFRFLNTRDKGTYNVFDPRFREDANLTKDETIELLKSFSSLNVYTTYIKNNDLEIDGKFLSKLTTSKLVKKSPELGKIGDAVERSLLAKEIRQLLTATGEEKILKLRRSSSFEAPSI